MELQAKDSQGGIVTVVFPWEEMEKSLIAKLKEPSPSEAELAEERAELADQVKAYAELEEEVKGLRDFKARLNGLVQTPEGMAEIIREADFDNTEKFAKLAEALGMDVEIEEPAAEVKVEEPAPMAPAEPVKQEPVYIDWLK